MTSLPSSEQLVPDAELPRFRSHPSGGEADYAVQPWDEATWPHLEFPLNYARDRLMDRDNRPVIRVTLR